MCVCVCVYACVFLCVFVFVCIYFGSRFSYRCIQLQVTDMNFFEVFLLSYSW